MKIKFFESLSSENNSIINNSSIQESKKLITNRKKAYPNLYQLNMKEFNKSNKVEKYENRPDLKEIIHFDIRSDNQDKDKCFVVEVRIKDHETKKEIAFTAKYLYNILIYILTL